MGKVAVPQSDSVPQCGWVCRGLRISPLAQHSSHCLLCRTVSEQP